MFFCPLSSDASLKLLELRHAGQMQKLIASCRPYLSRWLPWAANSITVADSRNFIEVALKGLVANRSLHAGIWTGSDLAGVIGCDFNWSGRSATLGYWLGEDFQGRGLMTLAAQAMISHCFDELDINRVEIRCGLSNQSSRAIPQRLGFIQEGTIRDAEWLGDCFTDHVIYGLLAREWKPQR